VGEWSRISWHR